jgi:transcription elongation GreA/GreB family factor
LNHILQEGEDMLTELKARLGSELERLAQEMTSRIPVGSVETVVAFNGAGMADPGNRLQDRVRRLGQLVAALPRVDPGTIWPEQAGFGSTVELQDLDTGEELTYTLLAGEFIDVDAGEVSLASPIGQALLGRRAGEKVAVVTPRGQRRFQIVSLTTLPQMLGIADAAPAVCA